MSIYLNIERQRTGKDPNRKRKWYDYDDDLYDGSFFVECESWNKIYDLVRYLETVLHVPSEEFCLIRKLNNYQFNNLDLIRNLEYYDIENMETIIMKIPPSFVAPWDRDHERSSNHKIVKSHPFSSNSTYHVVPGCFPQYDKYPVPLSSGNKSRRVYGADRWRYAIWYLQPQRFREIMMEENHLFMYKEPKICKIIHTKCGLLKPIVNIISEYFTEVTIFELEPTYFKSLVSELCSSIHFSNFSYRFNQEIYREMIQIACERLSDDIWLKFSKLVKNNKTVWGDDEINDITKALKEEDRKQCRLLLVQKGIKIEEF